MMRQHLFIFFLLFVLVSGNQKSSASSYIADGVPIERDGMQVSLLTCSPGPLIYELYGHTALRVRDSLKGFDWVFNYGVFSFSKPNFIWRFVKGDTDYELGVIPYEIFADSYAARGSDVTEQVLDLDLEEKKKLFESLSLNYEPENRVYRYNFLYDNCTTRARDQIESCVKGTICYTIDDIHGRTWSYRDIIHEFTRESPWSEFGQDLLLGAEADKPITVRQQMFSPFFMLTYADSAKVERGGTVRPLVKSKNQIVHVKKKLEQSRFVRFTPLTVSVLYLLFTLGVCMAEWRFKKNFWGYDLLLYGLQGMIGCIIAFLMLFSEHPTVGSNWLIIVFNPLTLFYMPWIIMNKYNCRMDAYHIVAVVVLTFFIVLKGVIPQYFPIPIVILALNLWVRSVSNLVICYNKKKMRHVPHE